MKISFRVTLIALALLALLTTSAHSGNFTVSPIRVEIERGMDTAILKFKNISEKPLTLQVSIKGWSIEEDGTDTYTDAGDLIFFPRIFTMEKNEAASLRIAYKGKPPEKSEKSYRIFAAEIPDKLQQTGVTMRLTLSVPLFIKPENAKPVPSLEVPNISDTGLVVPVANTGNEFFMLNKIIARGLDKEGKELFTAEKAGWYMLAGNARSFTVDIPGDQFTAVDTLDISLQWNDKNSMAKTFDYEAVLGQGE